MSVLKNIENARNALDVLEDHCLCARAEQDEHSIIVYLPFGYSVDAVRTDFYDGKANAYERVEKKLEEIWQESLFWK